MEESSGQLDRLRIELYCRLRIGHRSVHVHRTSDGVCGVHDRAQLELDTIPNWQPVQLNQTWGHVITRVEFQNETHSSILNALQWLECSV